MNIVQNFLSGYRTYLAGLGLILTALVQYSDTGDLWSSADTFFLGVATITGRAAISSLGSQARNQVRSFVN